MVFRRVYGISTSDYQLHHVCTSVGPSGCQHATTLLPLEGYSWSFIFQHFSKNLSIKFMINYRLTKITGTLQESLCILIIISRSIWDMTRLEAAEMRFLGSVKGYTRLDKIRSEVIRKELEISGILDVRSRHKQNWINHLERMDNTRLPKHAFNYKPRI